MQLEDYFDFLAPNDIRIKSSRIGIETVLYEYIHNAQTPEQIDVRYGSIDLEQVYATILYYLQNQDKICQYMADWLDHGDRMREEQDKNPDPVITKLRKLKEAYGSDAAKIVREKGVTLALAETPAEYKTK